MTMPADAVARPAWTRELSWWLADNFVYGLFPLALAACLAGLVLPGPRPARPGRDRRQL